MDKERKEHIGKCFSRAFRILEEHWNAKNRHEWKDMYADMYVMAGDDEFAIDLCTVLQNEIYRNMKGNVRV